MTSARRRVLAHLAAPLLPDFGRIHEAVARHHVDQGEAGRFVESLLGIRLDRESLARGRAFCAGVVERAGTDVTIVAFSIMVGKALQAAEKLAAEGIEAEVIDLRSLRPLDTATIVASVSKTNRIVTVEEGWPIAGIGSEIAARAMGIDTRNLKLLAFGMGATLGGVSGTLFASFQGFVSPESFSLMESVMIVAMVVLGGLGHIPGVILGAFLLAALPEVLRHVAGPLQAMTDGRLDAAILRQLLIALAMILVMLLKPMGLWPAPEHGVASPKKKNGDPS